MKLSQIRKKQKKQRDVLPASLYVVLLIVIVPIVIISKPFICKLWTMAVDAIVTALIR